MNQCHDSSSDHDNEEEGSIYADPNHYDSIIRNGIANTVQSSAQFVTPAKKKTDLIPSLRLSLLHNSVN